MNRRTLMAGSTALMLSTLIPSSEGRRGTLAAPVATPATAQGTKPRARDLGIAFDGTPGPLNAITDVAGVCVAHLTLIEGDGALDVGAGPIRTGLTAVLPRADLFPVFGGWDMLNGIGEMTGTEVLEESGFLTGPVLTTNTSSVGVARDAVTSWAYERLGPDVATYVSAPVVGETWDGTLNDIYGQHVTSEHVFTVLDALVAGVGSAMPVAEGNVGGGTGMICHEFKGGIGTASRRLDDEHGGYTVGVLVQANHGYRGNLTIAGVPVGHELPDLMPEYGGIARSRGGKVSSIIGIVATDAPLLPHQLKRLAKRVGLGVAIVGGRGEDASGDIFLAFSTAYGADLASPGVVSVDMLSFFLTDPLLDATVRATEEAIVNALVAAETMTGIDGTTVHALPHDRLQAVLRQYNRLAE